ncbi:MAG: hypothetical protein ACFE9D_12230, partial [Promethearchaeota archaeon]
LRHQIGWITATVSSLDVRAQQFYFTHLEFQRSGSRLDETGFKLFLAEASPQALIDVIDRIDDKK